MPKGRGFERHTMLGMQPLAHLRQRQIGFRFDPGAKLSLQGRNNRPAIPSDGQAGALAVPGQPLAHQIDPHTAHFKALCHGRRALAALQCEKHPITQILRVWTHMLPLHGQEQHITMR